MNKVQLSGIVRDIIERESSAGRFLTAHLWFRQDEEILLVIVEEKMKLFGPFETGDAVRVTGHLSTVNGNLVVLLDEVGPWKIAHAKPDSMFMRDVGAVRQEEASRGKVQSWRR